MNGFDPNQAAQPGSGIFGLPPNEDSADLVLVPVPFDATTSYGIGAAEGPAAIRKASHQVDLFDLQTGKPYTRGIVMLATDPRFAELNRSAREAALPIHEQGGAGPDDRDAVALVDRAGALVNEIVYEAVKAQLSRGKLCGVVGGDHAVPFGAIAAVAEQFPGVGILHFDAHADLRRAYEGFEWSHASILNNVLRKIPAVGPVAQVGLRDICEEEFAAITANGQVMAWFDLDIRQRLALGESLMTIWTEVVEYLPDEVYLSFDVDGLDPSLCPNTGTPVPGGLSFVEACLLLDVVVNSGRRIVGFDLCEVAPGGGGSDWDANVGARLLYKLCGFALMTF